MLEKIIQINLNFALLINSMLVSISVNLFSQTSLDNHKKYWYYKSRLNNDFVKVGLKAGESMPFNQRGVNTTAFSLAEKALHVGDGTSGLGYYIGVLATEYALLKNSYQKYRYCKT